ncbi:hypothetical protein C804_04757 [Lachnospiraceae bacterium A4]|nr:hypothetical protein C804_04757 [Lachnospiraceae bacterium A4]
MSDNDNTTRKSSDKKPVPFRIEQETAEKLRALSKDFSNQDSAFNALIAAYERENLMMAQPQFSEDIRQFEEYQRFLSAKYTDMLNALVTADERARTEVRELLASKDATIQDLQSQLEKAKSSRETYEKFYHDGKAENEAVKKELEKEQLVSQGLRSEIREKEEQNQSIISDKDRLNDILSKAVDEKTKELEKLAEYPQRLEKDRQTEQARADIRREMEADAARQREKHEAEMERIREKYEQAQSKIQELMERENRAK